MTSTGAGGRRGAPVLVRPARSGRENRFAWPPGRLAVPQGTRLPPRAPHQWPTSGAWPSVLDDRERQSGAGADGFLDFRTVRLVRLIAQEDENAVVANLEVVGRDRLAHADAGAAATVHLDFHIV